MEWGLQNGIVKSDIKNFGPVTERIKVSLTEREDIAEAAQLKVNSFAIVSGTPLVPDCLNQVSDLPVLYHPGNVDLCCGSY
jgi:hypothetical protein